MTEDKNHKTDLQHEGKDLVSLDIDRMINEGMAGGTVRVHGQYTNIEEARDLAPEEPPNMSE